MFRRGLGNFASCVAVASSNPMVRNGVIGFGLSGSADIFTQKVVEKSDTWDRRRTLAFATFTGVYAGVVYTHWFAFLDRRFGTTRALKPIAIKTALENFVHGPLLYYPTFFMTGGGVLRGFTPQESFDRMKEMYIETNIHSVTLWVPAMIVLFGFAPPAVRVPCMLSVETCWSGILSFLSNRRPVVSTAVSPV